MSGHNQDGMPSTVTPVPPAIYPAARQFAPVPDEPLQPQYAEDLKDELKLCVGWPGFFLPKSWAEPTEKAVQGARKQFWMRQDGGALEPWPLPYERPREFIDRRTRAFGILSIPMSPRARHEEACLEQFGRFSVRNQRWSTDAAWREWLQMTIGKAELRQRIWMQVETRRPIAADDGGDTLPVSGDHNGGSTSQWYP